MQIPLAADNPANPAAPSTAFVRPVNVLAENDTQATAASENAMPMAMPKAKANAGAMAPATGTVNAADPAGHTVNITHRPIKALGWPSMTMNFPVAPSVDLTGIRQGEKVDFMLGAPDADGNRRIERIMPASGSLP